MWSCPHQSCAEISPDPFHPRSFMPGQTYGFAFWKPFHIKRSYIFYLFRGSQARPRSASPSPTQRQVFGVCFCSYFWAMEIFRGLAWRGDLGCPNEGLSLDSMLLLSTQNLVSWWTSLPSGPGSFSCGKSLQGGSENDCDLWALPTYISTVATVNPQGEGPAMGSPRQASKRKSSSQAVWSEVCVLKNLCAKNKTHRVLLIQSCWVANLGYLQALMQPVRVVRQLNVELAIRSRSNSLKTSKNDVFGSIFSEETRWCLQCACINITPLFTLFFFANAAWA